VYASSRWTEVTGRSVDESQGWAWLDSIHPDDVARVSLRWKRSLRGTLPFESEHRLRDERTGAYRWMLARATPAFDHRGHVSAWYGTSTDISEKKRAESDLRVLLDLGTRLLSSLEAEDAYRALLRAIVPGHAACAFLVSIEGRSASLAALLPAAAGQPERPPHFDIAGTQILGSARSGLPRVLTSIDAEALGPFAEMLPRIRLTSGLTVPVCIGRRVVGLLAAFTSAESAAFSERDLPLFCELASRLATALRVTETFEHDHKVASEFQRAALPVTLPSAEGVNFDAFYEAGRSEALVGGDWYDAVELLDGRILVSVGDVSGSGLAAAVVMSHVRQSFRAAAQLEPDPLAILDAADRALRAEDPDRIVTAFVGLLDPLTGDFWYACAGHPRPIVRFPDGTLHELATDGLPIGLRTKAGRGTAGMLRLPPGSLVVLYTDGLVESTRDIYEGERALREAICDPAVRDAAAPARAIRERVLGGESNDDTAILTIRLPANEAPLEGVAPRRWRFDASDHGAAATARREFALELKNAGARPAQIANAEIVFGELTGNAARHTTGTVEVRLQWTGRHPVLHVLDEGPGYVKSSAPPRDALSESGRGLFLVSTFVEDFNVSRRPSGGTHTRAVLPAR
jgi:PAS domain S-box-containing protein